ncbi:MAG: hypothetical protein R3D89_03715 [Sphingomonadaceae bacterium]
MAQEQFIHISKFGRLANQMLQLMFAHELKRRIGRDILITGYDIPEFGLSGPERPEDGDIGAQIVIAQHITNLDQVALAMRQRLVRSVNVNTLGMRLEYYRDRGQCIALFPDPDIPFYRPASDELVMHVRAGDTLEKVHYTYMPMPLSWYRAVVAEQPELRPVFVGEYHGTPLETLLREEFPEATLRPAASAIADFQTLRHAHHVSMSVGTFGWLATWLSLTAKTIHMPVAGLLMPMISTTLLTPVDDSRYRFYQTPYPRDKAEKEALDMFEWIATAGPVERMPLQKVALLARKALFDRPNAPAS